MSDAASVRCEWCAQPAAAGSTDCTACGGPVDLLEPWVIACGWCASPNRRDLTPSCTRCGGPLPSIPGAHPGPRPPDAPRVLPSGYRWRTLLWRNVYVLLGVIFTIPFCWSILFPVIGIFLWRHGLQRAHAILDALILGTPTRGRILKVALDTSTTINGQHPWKIEFEYDTPEGVRPGAVEAWDPAHGHRPPGEHLWVVHLPQRPDCHALWPPVR